MINPEQLRIGNIITLIAKTLLPGDSMDESVGVSFPIRVETIDRNVICVINKGKLTPGIHFKHFDPIPISDNLLIKIGFQWDKNKEYMFLWKDSIGMEITIYKGDWFIFNYDSSGGQHSIIGTAFHYLHQLQNIFFALTGEELEIKLS